MGICISAGQDPATVSIRMNCLDGSYDYLEVETGEDDAVRILGELAAQIVRMKTYKAWRDRERARQQADSGS